MTKKIEIQPGITLFKPDHKKGIITALNGYFKSKRKRRRRPRRKQ